MKLLRLPLNVVRFVVNKALDELFGPSEEFTYTSTTTPQQYSDNPEVDAILREHYEGKKNG